jgi:hypothetical protein
LAEKWLYISWHCIPQSIGEQTMQNNAPRRTEPAQTLLEGKPYQRGADVQAVWRKYGWVPPTEQKEPKQ